MGTTPPPRRAVTRSRSSVAALRPNVSASTASAGQRIGGIGEPRADRLHDRGRLAGAGAGQHQQRTVAVLDDPLLLVVEDGAARWRRRAHVQFATPWTMDTTRVRHPGGTVWDDHPVSPDVPTPTDVADPPRTPPRTTSEPSPPDAAAAPPDAVASVVIEDRDIPRRVRRPLDLARFVLALVIAAATVLVAWFATSTAAGLDSDISSGASLLPSFVVLALNIIGGIGTLGLPIAVAVDLTLRRRLRQLFDSFVALLIAVVVLTLASYRAHERRRARGCWPRSPGPPAPTASPPHRSWAA